MTKTVYTKDYIEDERFNINDQSLSSALMHGQTVSPTVKMAKNVNRLPSMRTPPPPTHADPSFEGKLHDITISFTPAWKCGICARCYVRG